MRFGDMKIKTKLIMLIAIALAASVVIGYMGITELAEVNINTQDITKRYLPSLQNILNADRDLYQAEIARKELIQAEPEAALGQLCS